MKHRRMGTMSKVIYENMYVSKLTNTVKKFLLLLPVSMFSAERVMSDGNSDLLFTKHDLVVGEK